MKNINGTQLKQFCAKCKDSAFCTQFVLLILICEITSIQ